MLALAAALAAVRSKIGTAAPVVPEYLLLEDGSSFLLLESGDKLLLE